MIWPIELDPPAVEELARQDRAVQWRLTAFLRDRMAELADPCGIGEALHGPEHDRFSKHRVGEWRTIGKIHDRALTVRVLRIGRRRDVVRR